MELLFQGKFGDHTQGGGNCMFLATNSEDSGIPSLLCYSDWRGLQLTGEYFLDFVLLSGRIYDVIWKSLTLPASPTFHCKWHHVTEAWIKSFFYQERAALAKTRSRGNGCCLILSCPLQFNYTTLPRASKITFYKTDICVSIKRF